MSRSFFVATPNFNYGRYLENALESVQQQEGVNVVHHVQDGRSTDDSLAVLHKYRGLVSYRSEKDEGQCDALNRAFSECPETIDYVGWLNSDEYLAPFALREVANAFEDRPNLDVIYGDSVHVDAHGGWLRLVAQHRFSPRVLRHYGPYPQTGSTFYRAWLLRSGVLRLDTQYRQAMDYELYLRLQNHGAKFGYTRSVLSYFRIHEAQLTAQNGPSIAAGEKVAVARRYAFTRRPVIGKVEHQVLKLCSGSYVRELATRRFIGSETMWMTRDGE